MKRIVIEIAEEGDPSPGYDVVTEDGRRCDGLAWDEMLGQVVALTHHGLRTQSGYGYRMQTAEQWAAEKAAMFDRMERARKEQSE